MPSVKQPAVCCSTGWLTHWGDDMANTSAQLLADSLHRILSYANGTGSVNFYMLHGGSNFGGLAGKPFQTFTSRLTDVV